MSDRRLALVGIAGLAALALGPGLGGSGRLTYHEAFVAQSAREMLEGGGGAGGVLVPRLDGRPWLEKPPLAIWLVALLGRVAGGVDEAVARLPSAAAAGGLALAVAGLAARRYGPGVGALAGAVQATTAWAVMRGRLAEADMLLAALVAATIGAFDRLRAEDDEAAARPWRLAFFAGLGLASLLKGIGFGAALVVATVALTLALDRDRRTLRRLVDPTGWALAALLTLAWPALVVARHPEAIGLWAFHLAGRLAARPEQLAARPWWEYALSPFWQTLPWTPLALIGAWRSVRRRGPADGEHDADARAGDRLLWAWALGPVALLSMATVKNPHYLIHALPPWSIWAARSLARMGGRLEARGWPRGRVRMAAISAFAVGGLACGLGFAGLGPRFDRRGVEWAFYRDAARALRPGEPLALLYDDWDRLPYPSPFGPMPHDLAVRLFYLGRPACWRQGADDLARRPPSPPPAGFALIARARDLPALRRLGRVETVARGPSPRFDRTFRLYRIRPSARMASADDREGRMGERSADYADLRR